MENVHAVNLTFRRRNSSILLRGHNYGASQEQGQEHLGTGLRGRAVWQMVASQSSMVANWCSIFNFTDANILLLCSPTITALLMLPKVCLRICLVPFQFPCST